jgi:N,N'-diacetyllegionaminate synthase
MFQPNHPFLIAEIGVNHDGSIDRAEAMIEASANAGFDAVKFQYWIIDEFLAASVPRAQYQGEGDQRELLSQLALSLSELAILRTQSTELGLQFAVTPYGPQACRDIATLQPDFVKIGSGDATNPFVLEEAASMGLPMIVATGMCTDEEVLHVDRFLSGASRTYLHCISAYPTPIEAVNLARMDEIRKLTGCLVGFSDHTIGSAASIAAVALGAVAIEKHVTLNRNLPGPDHAASLELGMAQAWVSDLRAIGTGVHAPRDCPEEAANKSVVRKGLYMTSDLEAGSQLQLHHVEALRPLLDAIPSLDVHSVVGKIASRSLRKGEALLEVDIA